MYFSFCVRGILENSLVEELNEALLHLSAATPIIFHRSGKDL